MSMQPSENPREWTSNFMDGCQQLAQTAITPYLGKMFENCHLAMLEFADKAESNTSQIQFMEAGNVIKKNRAAIELTFFGALAREFNRFKQRCQAGNSEPAAGSPGSDLREDQMSLVSKDDTDIQVAIQNMVASASLGSQLALHGIRQRLSVLHHGRKLEEMQIPAGPHALANAFHEAVESLALEHESRLIVYLLFDKFVLSNTAELYEQYNERLIKAGLLQNLKYAAPRNAETPSRKHPAPSPQAAADRLGPTSISDELFGSILELMTSRHPQQGPAPGRAVPRAEIVSAIHQVQEHSSRETVHEHATRDSGMHTRDVAGMVAALNAERERLFNGIDRRRIPSADTQMIDLVGMMFEYLLNNEDIPNAAKAELSRLHTPYLKIAIIDNGLFTNREHTAHVFLNELAEASMHWVFEDDLERGIYPCMRKLIARVLIDFHNDLSLFDELLETLRDNVHDLEQKAGRLEEHTRQAADGREKLELARVAAETAITGMVERYTVPAAIRELLGETWSNKLTFIFLREPGADQSDSWQLAVQTIESILWCSEPRSSHEQQDELGTSYLGIHNQIAQSMETLSAYGMTDIEADMAVIRASTQAALSTDTTVEQPDEVAAAGTDAAPAMQENDADDAPRGILAGYLVDHDHDAGTNASGEDEPAVTPEHVAAMDQLDEMPFGSWFILQQDDTRRRVKLSWHSHISGNYMFVDGMGKRAAVLHRTDLVQMLVDGKAQPLGDEQEPFIQRALQTIRRVLGGKQASY